MPIQKIDPAKAEAIVLRAEYLNDNKTWYPFSGGLGGQIESCFDSLLQAGSDDMRIPIEILWNDYENREYSVQCVIRKEADALCLVSKRIWCELA